MGLRPPALARILVRFSACLRDRDFLLGDLEERFCELAQRHGSRTARRWYWKQALSAVPWAVASHWARLRPTSWSPLSGIGEAARNLARTPIFTGVSILSVGIGVGLAVSVFTVAHAVFFTPSPYPDPQQLVTIWETQRPGSHQKSDYLRPARMQAWVETRMRYLTGISGYGLMQDMVLESGGTPTRVAVRPVLGDWFGTLGTPAVLGRVLTKADHRPGAESAAVVSWAFWKEQLGGRSDALGHVLHFLKSSFTVVGVMPPTFDTDALVWVPEESLPANLKALAWAGVARLRPGSTQRQARQEIEERSAAQVAADSARWGGFGATTLPMPEAGRSGNRSALWMLVGVVVAVLLIGLTNLTTLFLVRAQERSVNLAVRASLGANTWQIGRGLFMEALLVGLGGAAGGVLLAVWGRGVTASLVFSGSGPSAMPRLGLLSVGVAAALGVLVTLVVGLEPLRRLRVIDVRDLLQRRTAGSSSTRGERRGRDVMVGAQVAACVVLVATLGIFAAAYRSYTHIDVGYDARRLVEAVPDYEVAQIDGAVSQWRLARQIGDRVAHDPAVAGVALWEEVSEAWPYRPELNAVIGDSPRPPTSYYQQIWAYYEVNPGFFRSMGIPLLKGRTFTDADNASSPPVAIVTKNGPDAWWPGENPLGHRIKLGRNGEWLTIVGVVANTGILGSMGRGLLAIRHGTHQALLFRPARQTVGVQGAWKPGVGNTPHIAVRAARDPAAAARAVRSGLRSAAPNIPLKTFSTLYQGQMHGWIADRLEVGGSLVGAGAVVGLLLAVLGIAGVVADGVARRTPEIGLRVALGARAVHVLSSIARESLLSALSGLGAGLILVIVLRNVIPKVVVDTETRALMPRLTDPRLLAAVAGIVLTIVLFAALVPASRTVRIDPAEALRSE